MGCNTRDCMVDCPNMFLSIFVFRKDRGGRRILLVIMSLMFGAEIGFKLATRQLIYILNPCHVTTAFQVRN